MKVYDVDVAPNPARIRIVLKEKGIEDKVEFVRVGIAILATVAATGLLAGLPHNIGRHLTVVTLRERIAVFGRSDILLALFVTMLWSMGAFTIYAYLATYLTTAISIGEAKISFVLMLWGAPRPLVCSQGAPLATESEPCR